VGPRASLNVVEKKITCPCRESKPNSSAVKPVAGRYTDSAIRTPAQEITGPKREIVAERWKKLQTEELHNLYSLHNIMVIKLTKDEVGKTCNTYRRNETF
jgi:hypothetical protein